MNVPSVRLECMWCGSRFAPRSSGGHRQRYCSPTCRRALDTARRRYIAEALASGALTIDGLKTGPATTRALNRHSGLPTHLSDIEPDDPALSALLRVRGRMVVRLPISPEGIGELARLGWLAPRDCHTPATVADALIELANTALDNGLRPGC